MMSPLSLLSHSEHLTVLPLSRQHRKPPVKAMNKFVKTIQRQNNQAISNIDANDTRVLNNRISSS